MNSFFGGVGALGNPASGSQQVNGGGPVQFQFFVTPLNQGASVGASRFPGTPSSNGSNNGNQLVA